MRKFLKKSLEEFEKELLNKFPKVFLEEFSINLPSSRLFDEHSSVIISSAQETYSLHSLRIKFTASTFAPTLFSLRV